ncbi:MAG TPA: cupredoxin domain-containing protein [Chthoniobacterales bacterium]|jgi:hypothetical protein
MNIKIFALLTTAACAFTAMPVRAEDKTASEKTAEAWDATKKTTKDVTRKVVNKTKDAASTAEAAISKPDEDARKVQVTVTDKGVQMPKTLPPGKTAFIVRNTGKQEHGFEIKGQALEKSFWFDIAPGSTKTMQVDLKAGSYEADCRTDEHQGKELKTQVTVK